MDPLDRLKLYATFVETTCKWITSMDVKAGFFSALNGALLALLLGPSKLVDGSPVVQWLGVSAAIVALISLLAALRTIAPRESLRSIFGGKAEWNASYKPLSFYAYVATAYTPEAFEKFEADFERMDIEAFSREALEQHFSIACVAKAKSIWVSRCSKLTSLAIVLSTLGIFSRHFGW